MFLLGTCSVEVRLVFDSYASWDDEPHICKVGDENFLVSRNELKQVSIDISTRHIDWWNGKFPRAEQTLSF